MLDEQRAEELARAIIFAEDDEFEAVLNRCAPSQIPDRAVCGRCGRPVEEHRMRVVCPTEAWGMFQMPGDSDAK
jgi:nitrite reductase/ring-hydroxylating ferredoxin subunit